MEPKDKTGLWFSNENSNEKLEGIVFALQRDVPFNTAVVADDEGHGNNITLEMKKDEALNDRRVTGFLG